MTRRGQARKGDQVEMFDGSHRGVITEVKNEFCLAIKWDDGEVGFVHPLDVKHLGNDKGGR